MQDESNKGQKDDGSDKAKRLREDIRLLYLYHFAVWTKVATSYNSSEVLQFQVLEDPVRGTRQNIHGIRWQQNHPWDRSNPVTLDRHVGDLQEEAERRPRCDVGIWTRPKSRRMRLDPASSMPSSREEPLRLQTHGTIEVRMIGLRRGSITSQKNRMWRDQERERGSREGPKHRMVTEIRVW